MRRPGIATIGSIGLHAAVVALALIPWPRKDAPVMVSSVPVSIVSSEVAAAAPADNPSDELVDAEALEAVQELLETEALLEEIPEVPTPPQPRPPEPSPERADTRRPDPTPSPRPSQTPPEKARPTPAPRPSQNRPDPGLDLDALAESRPRTHQQRPTGQSGAGQAPRATGSQIANLGGQIVRHWNLPCDLPGGNEFSIPIRVTITSEGRVSSGPVVTERRAGPVWQAASEAMLRAVRAAEPFDVPDGFETQEISFLFRADQACANR